MISHSPYMVAVPPSVDWQRAAQTALDHAAAMLWSPAGASALHYLRAERGLSDDTIRAFGLGYNPSWMRLNYADPDMGKAIMLAPGLIIPWIVGGQVWNVRIRCRVGAFARALGRADDILSDGDPMPKYMGLRGGRGAGVPFNGDALEGAGDLLIVEGEFDAMLAAQSLSDARVITFGSAASLPGEQWHMAMQRARVVLGLDNDESGRAAADRIRAVTPNAFTLTVPSGKDITDYVLAGGDLVAWWASRSAQIEKRTRTATLWTETIDVTLIGMNRLIAIASRRYPIYMKPLTAHMGGLSALRARLQSGAVITKDDMSAIINASSEITEIDSVMFYLEERRTNTRFDVFCKRLEELKTLESVDF